MKLILQDQIWKISQRIRRISKFIDFCSVILTSERLKNRSQNQLEEIEDKSYQANMKKEMMIEELQADYNILHGFLQTI